MELKFEPQISDNTRKNYVHSNKNKGNKVEVKSVNRGYDLEIIFGFCIFASVLLSMVFMTNPKKAMASEGLITNIIAEEAYSIAKLDTLKIEAFPEEIEEVVEEVTELERLAKAEENRVDLITVENASDEPVVTGFVSEESANSSNVAEASSQSLLDTYSYALYDSAGRRNDINEHLLSVLEDTCALYGINPHLVLGVIMTESEGHANAKNRSSTASGFGQILKGTGKYVYEDLMGNGKGTYNHSMAFDPETNIRMTATYLGNLVRQRGSVQRALQNYRGKSNIASYVNKINSHIGKAGLSVGMM